MAYISKFRKTKLKLRLASVNSLTAVSKKNNTLSGRLLTILAVCFAHQSGRHLPKALKV